MAETKKTLAPWSAVRRVYMSKRPKASEQIFGFTRRMVARLAGLSAEQAASVRVDDFESLVRMLAKRIAGRDAPKWHGTPNRNPSGRLAPLPAFYSHYSLIYSPRVSRADELPNRPPTPEELEHTASQLRAFKSRAKVRGHHIQVGSDLYSLQDARRLLAVCEAYQAPATRTLWHRAVQALRPSAMRRASRGRSRGLPHARSAETQPESSP